MLTILTQALIDMPTSLLTEDLTVKTLLLFGLIFYINKDNKNKEEIDKLREKNKEELEKLQEKLEIRLKDSELSLEDCEKDLRRKELEFLEMRIKKADEGL